MASFVTADLTGSAYPDQGAPAALAEDVRLIEGLQAGAESDYELLIARFQQPVYNLALRLVAEPADAGDLVQEVFLKIFRNIQRFRGQSSLRTWIYRIAVNEAHNYRRWVFRHRHNEVGLEDSDPCGTPHDRNVPDREPSPYDQTLNRERLMLIEEALARINPSFREAVVLRDIEDLSYDEIAEILNINIGTVKSRILRGRDALRQQLTTTLRPAAREHEKFVPGTC
jgi:RNA polymerase sigma-70 factor (ECF subfamily)